MLFESVGRRLSVSEIRLWRIRILLTFLASTLFLGENQLHFFKYILNVSFFNQLF